MKNATGRTKMQVLHPLSFQGFQTSRFVVNLLMLDSALFMRHRYTPKRPFHVRAIM